MPMHHQIGTILQRLRQDLGPWLDAPAILQVCRDAGHLWRDGPLNPAATVLALLTQVLHRNTALSHLPHLTGLANSASAFCQARARLPLEVFHALVERLAASLDADTADQGRWRGHRTFLVDGSSFSMADTPPLQAHFGQPGNQRPGCGFPVAHLLVLFHASTGLLRDVLTAPLRTHDLAQAAWLHPQLGRGDVVVGDRAFCSFAHLALLADAGLHAVFRLHQRQIVDFTPHRPHASPHDATAPKGRPRSRWLRALGVTDQLVEWLKPRDRPPWMSAEKYAALPARSVVRELRYRVGEPGYRTRVVTLVATLWESEAYPVGALAELYRQRWQAETNLRHLKQTMGLDVLKCRTVAGVHKELLTFAMVYNLVRRAMVEASARQGVAVDRISFVDAMRWLASPRGAVAAPDLVVNRERPGRFEPRVVKRRPKPYPRLSQPRSMLRKRLKDQALTA